MPKIGPRIWTTVCPNSDISVLNQTFVLHLPKMDTGVQSWTLVPRNYGTLVSKFGHWSLKLDTSVQNSEI